MIEVDLIWDLLPGVDMQAWVEFAKKAVSSVLKAPGLVEFRSYRNMLGSPIMKATTRWQTLADYAKYIESAEWQALFVELREKWATNIRVEIWGPSPVVPEPLRPG